jgi:hypothetical protein
MKMDVERERLCLLIFRLPLGLVKGNVPEKRQRNATRALR